MRTKLLFFAFAMLTVSGMQSQDTITEPFTAVTRSLLKDPVTLILAKGDGLESRLRQAQPDMRAQPETGEANPDTLDIRPISFPFWMAKMIALDLEEKKQLEQEVLLLEKALENYSLLASGLEEKTKQRELQLQLYRKNMEILQLQLAKRRAPGKGDLVWMLRLLAAMGAGYVIGKF